MRFAVIGMGRFGSRLAASLTAANQEVIALRWDERTDRAEILGFRDLRADAANQNPSR